MDQAAVLNQSLPWQPVLPQKHLGTVLRPIDLNSFMVTARRLQTLMARNPGDSILARKAMADGAASNQIPGFRSNPRLWLECLARIIHLQGQFAEHVGHRGIYLQRRNHAIRERQ